MRAMKCCCAFLILVMMMAAAVVQADSQAGETVDWQVLSSGGGDCASTNYRVSGTLSQTAVGTSTSTNFGTHHGFWQDFGFGYVGCCGQYSGGLTGNNNCSTDGKLTLGDITSLIDHIYISKSPLCCHATGNTNGSTDCKFTLGDVTWLIDVIYISHQPPSPCMQDCEI
jgi:hypothetical protein